MKEKKVIFIALLCVVLLVITGCTVNANIADKRTQQKIAANLAENQPTPSDIDYSLERYNLIGRTYWVNGQHEKARPLPCPVEKPLGILGRFVVDGKFSSLNIFLTPDSEYYSTGSGYNH